jgi:hypothetical protein
MSTSPVELSPQKKEMLERLLALPLPALLTELARNVDARTREVVRILPPLMQHMYSLPDYTERMARYEKSNPGFSQSLITFAASLEFDWTQVKRTPRQEVRKRVKALKDACIKTARLMREYEGAYLLWQGLPESALSYETNFADTLHHASPMVSSFQLLEQMLHTGDPSARTFPLVSKGLALLGDSIDVRTLPIALQILPTKLGAREARGVYFVRALTWFFISNLDRSDDDVVSMLATHLSKRDIPPDHVAILRRRLQKQLKRPDATRK